MPRNEWRQSAASAHPVVIAAHFAVPIDLARRSALIGPLVRVRLGNMAARATCAIILARLPQIVAALDAGERIIEIR